MTNYSTPIAVDLREAGQVYISYEDVNGDGTVEIRWFQGDEEVPHFAAPHYDQVLRLVEVLLWGAMAARQEEQHAQQAVRLTDFNTASDTEPIIVEVVTSDELISRGAKLGERFQIIVNGEIKEGLWESTMLGLTRVDSTPNDDRQ